VKYRIAALALLPGIASAEPLTVPFDFSHGAIGLDVTVKGTPLHMLLDTGVDPSAIDITRADALGLKVDRGTSGEATGEGNAKEAKIFAATIDGLAIGGRTVPPIDAAAMDMAGLSAQYGRPLDGVLGYSFLSGRIVLIDYAHATLGILDKPADAGSSVLACRKHWSIALEVFGDDNIPKIPDFRLGKGAGSISLDTGSNGGVSLHQPALDLPGVQAALVEKGETSFAGARGKGTAKTYRLNAPVGFGPFTLPAGQTVTLVGAKEGADNRIANIGNKLFAAMKLKMLLDYRDRVMTFYGDCRSDVLRATTAR
jgi:hypothetical protein